MLADSMPWLYMEINHSRIEIMYWLVSGIVFKPAPFFTLLGLLVFVNCLSVQVHEKKEVLYPSLRL
jgi:hypothetical protein